MSQNHVKAARNVLLNEATAVHNLNNELDENFNCAVEEMLQCKGRLVLCGMGKSGYIAQKTSATLVSTGTPSLFMHPAEAFHGDLGLIGEIDVFLGFSNSGETEEIIRLIPYLKSKKIPIISITGSRFSTLARESKYHVFAGVENEACPLNVAPTTSTTAALAIGDAIAVALMKARDFTPEDFARFHPGGSLGKKLLVTVAEEMSPPCFVAEGDGFFDVVRAMTEKQVNVICVGSCGSLSGVVTDGDLRRAMAHFGSKVVNLNAYDLMGRSPKTVRPDRLVGDAESLMESFGVNSLVVTDGDSVLGVFKHLNHAS